jgi:hypothetical protein
MIEWLYAGSGFLIGFIELLTDPWLQVIITVSLIHTIYSSLEHSLLCLHQSFGNGFQRRGFPFLWVPELSPVSAIASLD